MRAPDTEPKVWELRLTGYHSEEIRIWVVGFWILMKPRNWTKTFSETNLVMFVRELIQGAKLQSKEEVGGIMWIIILVWVNLCVCSVFLTYCRFKRQSLIAKNNAKQILGICFFFRIFWVQTRPMHNSNFKSWVCELCGFCLHLSRFQPYVWLITSCPVFLNAYAACIVPHQQRMEWGCFQEEEIWRRTSRYKTTLSPPHSSFGLKTKHNWENCTRNHPLLGHILIASPPPPPNKSAPLVRIYLFI